MRAKGSHDCCERISRQDGKSLAYNLMHRQSCLQMPEYRIAHLSPSSQLPRCICPVRCDCQCSWQWTKSRREMLRQPSASFACRLTSYCRGISAASHWCAKLQCSLQAAHTRAKTFYNVLQPLSSAMAQRAFSEAGRHSISGLDLRQQSYLLSWSLCGGCQA